MRHMISPIYPWRRTLAGSRFVRLMASVCALLTLWAVFDSPMLLTCSLATVPASTPQTPMPQDEDDDILPPAVSLLPENIRSAAPSWNASRSLVACSTAVHASLSALTAVPSHQMAFRFDRHNGCGAVLRLSLIHI